MYFLIYEKNYFNFIPQIEIFLTLKKKNFKTFIKLLLVFILLSKVKLDLGFIKS